MDKSKLGFYLIYSIDSGTYTDSDYMLCLLPVDFRPLYDCADLRLDEIICGEDGEHSLNDEFRSIGFDSPAAEHLWEVPRDLYKDKESIIKVVVDKIGLTYLPGYYEDYEDRG